LRAKFVRVISCDASKQLKRGNDQRSVIILQYL
jgi:hypothetical protein